MAGVYDREREGWRVITRRVVAGATNLTTVGVYE